ncbi:MAG TPA: hypothetical protein VLG50_04900, partial [Candidatus Saccharimonadales bacterium]|nr:hypothetical protein [Candidatus Saccharimonadales bacterium]
MYTIRILIFSIVLLPNLCWSSSNQTLLTTSRPTEKLSFLSEFHTVYRDRLRTAICENDIAKIQYADP